MISQSDSMIGSQPSEEPEEKIKEVYNRAQCNEMRFTTGQLAHSVNINEAHILCTPELDPRGNCRVCIRKPRG